MVDDSQVGETFNAKTVTMLICVAIHYVLTDMKKYRK